MHNGKEDLKEDVDFLPSRVAAMEFPKSGRLDSLCEFSSFLRRRGKERK